jgi:hypothetical protein
MKFLKVLGIGLLILAGLGALAWVNRATVLSLIAQSRLPDVAPNREVVWEPGPADRPPTRSRPNVIFIVDPLTDPAGDWATWVTPRVVLR